MNKILYIITVAMVLISSYSSVSETNSSIVTMNNSFWIGNWGFVGNSGKLTMHIEIVKDGANNYKGHHCFVDGRIHGGAMDCTFDTSPNTVHFTLTNSNSINSNVTEFTFESGYFKGFGKARLIKIDNNRIRFIVTENPQMFEASPLANYLDLNSGLGADATGGVILDRE